MINKLRLWSFGILFLAAMSVACGSSPAANEKPANAPISVMTPDANTTPAPELMAAGKKLYMANCAACHKENGTGGKIEIEGKSINPDDLTSEKIKAFADDKIYGYIYKGIEDEGMPAFKDKLTEAEIREVVRYLRVELQKLPETTIKKATQQ